MQVKIEQAMEIPGARYRNQWALFEANGMWFPFQVGLGDEDRPYPVGNYELDPGVFATSKYHKLELGFVRLIPVQNKDK